MGLLSNPKTRNKIANLIAKYNNRLCVLCYLVGVIWFLALAHVQLNARTYFSENALLPGLVDPDFQHGHGSGDYFQELKSIVKDRKPEAEEFQIPSEWLVQKFAELRLDAYTHNYSFKYPYNILQGQSVRGQNVYAILRAPRAAGTEAVVLSAPFRADHDSTLAGIGLMLGLAKAFNRHTYWAKDIIFLVTDNQEIGMQAWLSAYHHSYNDFISAGHLPGRSGAIQAAINLEIGTDVVSRMDVRIEGLNGQLPNLDLVNTVMRLCRRESITPTLHRRTDYWNLDSMDGFQYSLKTMLMMMWRQAPGIPSGNHGLFHRYNVEAVTLHGTKLKNAKQNLGFAEMGRVLEGVFRSLNNLLERFHQSFFFYLLPSTDRYVSIGLYMPPFGLLVLSIAIKAIALWLSAGIFAKAEQEEEQEEGLVEGSVDASITSDDQEQKKKSAAHIGASTADQSEAPAKQDSQTFLVLLCYLPYFLTSCFFGLVAYYGPQFIISTAIRMHLSPESGLVIGFFAINVAVILYPLLQHWRTSKKAALIQAKVDARILKCIGLLAVGIVLSATAVMNISLAFLVAACWVPVLLFIRPSSSRAWQLIQLLCLIVISPFGLMFAAAIVNHLAFGKSSSPVDPIELILRGWEGVQAGLFTVAIQSQMLDNLTFGLISVALLPLWTLFRLVPMCDIPN